MYFMHTYFIKTGSSHGWDNNVAISFVLMGEHVFAYCTGIYRNWEIEHYGKLDINGILRAKTESMLSTFEIFLDCIIFGYSANYMFGLTWD